MRRPLWDIVVVSELLTLGFGCFYSRKVDQFNCCVCVSSYRVNGSWILGETRFISTVLSPLVSWLTLRVK